MSQIISIETGPGSWLELGSFEIDVFGDEEWTYSKEYRYPHYDKRLTVKRLWSRHSVQWKIFVPTDYPLTIIKRGGHEKEVLYRPQTLAQIQANAIAQVEEWLNAE